MILKRIGIATNIWPKLIGIASIFEMFFSYIGIPYLYVLFVVIGIILLRKNIRINSTFDDLTVLLISFLFVRYLFDLINSEYSTFEVTKAFLLYFLPVFYWFLLYKQRDSDFDLKDFFLFLKYPVLIVAILGIVQFFFSPSLFGIINVDSDAIEWASGDSYESYVSFFRSTSLMGSPQIYGLFMALYIPIYVTIKRKIDFISIIYFFAGALSGNKSFYFLLVLFGIMYIQRHYKNVLITVFAVAIVAFCLILFSKKFNELVIVSRVFNTEEVVQGERSGRLFIYKQIIKDLNIQGHGMGTKMSFLSEKNKDIQVTESSFLEISYEFGLLFFIFFLLWLIESILVNWKSDYAPILLLFYISMIFVHAHIGVQLFTFWLLVYPLPQSGLKRRFVN